VFDEWALICTMRGEVGGVSAKFEIVRRGNRSMRDEKKEDSGKTVRKMKFIVKKKSSVYMSLKRKVWFGWMRKETCFVWPFTHVSAGSAFTYVTETYMEYK
jgi:hypothetical protein